MNLNVSVPALGPPKATPYRQFPVTFTWRFPGGTESTYVVQMFQYEGGRAFTLDPSLMANQREQIEEKVNAALEVQNNE